MSSSAGIFAEPTIQVPKIEVTTIGKFNTSSVAGGARRSLHPLLSAVPHGPSTSLRTAGIFAEPEPFQVTPRSSQVTSSSVQGGIFAATGPVPERPMTARQRENAQRLNPAEQVVAGKKIERDGQAAEQPLQPIYSARTNQNSVDGGVFSNAAPTPVKKHKEGMRDPNASSIAGGIFG